jgi:hypothetical protein
LEPPTVEERPTHPTPKRPTGGPWRKRFLDHLRRCGNVSLAARKAGITRQHVYWCRSRDPRFDAAVLDSLEEATDLLEARARELALAGDVRTLLALLRWHRYGPRVATSDRPAVPVAVVRHEVGDTLAPFAGAVAAVLEEYRARQKLLENTPPQPQQLPPPEAPQ